MKTSLFLLATAALQAFAAPASSTTTDAKILVKSTLEADSLTNIYWDYGSQPIKGDVALFYGSCEDGSIAYEIDQFNLSDDFRPEKFAWHVPADAQSGCIFAKDASGNVIAQSESYTVSKKFTKRGHPELSDMYFDAVDYHKNKKVSKRAHASSKNKSKYSVCIIYVWLTNALYRNWYCGCWYVWLIQRFSFGSSWFPQL